MTGRQIAFRPQPMVLRAALGSAFVLPEEVSALAGALEPIGAFGRCAPEFRRGGFSNDAGARRRTRDSGAGHERGWIAGREGLGDRFIDKRVHPDRRHGFAPA